MPTGLDDLLSHMPAGHNDLWAGENITIRNSEFLYQTSFDHLIHIPLFFPIRFFFNIYMDISYIFYIYDHICILYM